jgi:hypothetical protein
MRLLYVLCEGDDDQQFFEHVIEPQLTYSTHEVKYVQYGQLPHKDVRSVVHSVHGMREDGLDADYVFLRDYDYASCKSARLDEINRKYQGVVARDKTFLVIQMIESWYVAGLKSQHDLSMLTDAPSQTDDLGKQEFTEMIDEDAVRTDVLQEILKRFDVDRARYKNDSFEYFCAAVLDE